MPPVCAVPRFVMRPNPDTIKNAHALKGLLMPSIISSLAAEKTRNRTNDEMN